MPTPRLLLDFDGQRLVGREPMATLEAKDGAWKWEAHDAWPFSDGRGDVFGEIRRALRWCRDEFGTDGAAIGYVAYDAARQLEARAFTPHSPPDDLKVPDLRLTFCRELTAHHSPLTTHPPPLSTHQNALSTDYAAAISRIKDYIAAGDIYQANFTQRFSAPLPCPPRELYCRLIAAHPMPYSALLDWDDLAVVSNSPERFLALKGNQLLAQPIKGTLRRGKDANSDAERIAALLASAKDRAENVMIVDLLRNDLGRVCAYGTVAVPELCTLKTFPTLHHLVSTVTGSLRPDCDAVDAFRAAFPCGSITGAPKIRAMQIIDELEPVRRGVAMGAIGYFGFNGDMEWNVAIRTMTCIRGTAYFHVGGGIVADSEPEAEYAEMMLKAQAIQSVLRD